VLIYRAEYSHPLYVKRMTAFSEELEERKFNEQEHALDKANEV